MIWLIGLGLLVIGGFFVWKNNKAKAAKVQAALQQEVAKAKSLIDKA